MLRCDWLLYFKDRSFQLTKSPSYQLKQTNLRNEKRSAAVTRLSYKVNQSLFGCIIVKLVLQLYVAAQARVCRPLCMCFVFAPAGSKFSPGRARGDCSFIIETQKNDPAKNSEGQSPHLCPFGHLIHEAEGLMVEDAYEHCGLQVILLEFLELCRAIIFAEAICFVVALSDVV